MPVSFLGRSLSGPTVAEWNVGDVLEQRAVRSVSEISTGDSFLNALPTARLQFNAQPLRCSLWVGREVLLVVRPEQRSDSWPCYSSERLGEGVYDLITKSQCKLALFFAADLQEQPTEWRGRAEVDQEPDVARRSAEELSATNESARATALNSRLRAHTRKVHCGGPSVRP